jgi:hypothetical protein
MQPEVLSAEIEAFGRDVLESSGRPLELLRSIEGTLNTLNRVTKKVNADCEFAHRSIDSLNRASTKVVDAPKAEKAVAVLEKAQQGVHNLYEELRQKRGHAKADKDLRPSDGVVEAFSEAIAAAADLHNAINQLRIVISELVVDSEAGEPKRYSPKQLKALLRDLKG